MADLVLYSTSGCHLCELAEDLLRAYLGAPGGAASLAWKVVDIADDDALFERYGWVIPVLADHCGQELRWPFDGHDLHRFLNPENS